MNSHPLTPTLGRGRAKAILISVVVIVAVGFGLTAAWNTRQIQHRMQCAANFERIAAALQVYLNRFGMLPQELQALEQGGLAAVELICPASRRPYSYHLPASAHLDLDAVLVSESVSNHAKGAHLLFGDYRFQFVPQEHLQRHLPGLSDAAD